MLRGNTKEMPTKVAVDLVGKLKTRQEDLSDQLFGEKLGISKQLWQMLRTGKRQIPQPLVLKGIAKAYPELALDVLIFLGFDVQLSSTTEGIPSKPPQTPQNKLWGALRVFIKIITLGIPCFKSSKANQPTKSKSERL